jgi:hypothetical protein
LVYAFVSGIGFGAYQSAVDYLSVTQVLPSNAEAGKDLGIVNISTSLPSNDCRRRRRGDDPWLPAVFPVGAALVVIGALFILPIRKTQ